MIQEKKINALDSILQPIIEEGFEEIGDAYVL